MKVEEQVLPDSALAPLYDKAVWVYVYRTFQKDEADRLAERISIRFGVSSWPQLFLVDPESLAILRHTGRSVTSFEKAFAATTVEKHATSTTHEGLKRAEEIARALEDKPSVKAARTYLAHDDIVVRTRALEILAEEKPKDVVAHAKDLLAVPNDPFRYLVCGVLAKAEDPKAAPYLEAVVKEPKDSLNPNVLRIRAVSALATCGTPSSVAVIAPHASSGAYFNGLTGTSIDALRDIAKRHKKARKEVRTVLIGAYPKPPPAEANDRAKRACVALAKRIHRALDARMKFPDTYDDAAREKLMTQKP